MIIIGHRGARGLAPENTLEGFKIALKHGAGQIEFDVQVTKDGIPVLSHNPGIISEDGSELLISGCSYKELKAGRPDLVTFEEAILAIGKKVPMYIEIKPEVPTAPIVKIIKKYLAKGFAPDNFELGSFSQVTLLELHTALPSTKKIVIERWSGLRATYRAKQLGSKIICMNQHFLWFGFIKAMKRGGYTLYTYTLNDPAKAKKWAKYGLTGVVTDYPDRFKS